MIEYSCDPEDLKTIEINGVYRVKDYDFSTMTGENISHLFDLDDLTMECVQDMREREIERAENMYADYLNGQFDE